jgi:hypothetical protein
MKINLAFSFCKLAKKGKKIPLSLLPFLKNNRDKSLIVEAIICLNYVCKNNQITFTTIML